MASYKELYYSKETANPKALKRAWQKWQEYAGTWKKLDGWNLNSRFHYRNDKYKSKRKGRC